LDDPSLQSFNPLSKTEMQFQAPLWLSSCKIYLAPLASIVSTEIRKNKKATSPSLALSERNSDEELKKWTDEIEAILTFT